MKIVIDIEDYDKEWIANGYHIPDEINGKIAEAIIDGTPLPKEHGRLIDADDVALIDEQFYVPSDYYVAESAIEDAPTIIEGSDSE